MFAVNEELRLQLQLQLEFGCGLHIHRQNTSETERSGQIPECWKHALLHDLAGSGHNDLIKAGCGMRHDVFSCVL